MSDTDDVVSDLTSSVPAADSSVRLSVGAGTSPAGVAAAGFDGFFPAERPRRIGAERTGRFAFRRSPVPARSVPVRSGEVVPGPSGVTGRPSR
nr:hypothetical protein [Gordonia sp. LAM0048]